MPSSSLPKTYKAAVFKEKGAPLTIEEVELKLPERGEILVKVKACGVCHADASVQSGDLGNSFPLVPGHEIIGHVVAVGEDVTKWKEGDYVGGTWHGGHDGLCRQCNRGLFQMCANSQINGVTKNGGYAEYTLIRAEAAVRVPADADADASSCAPLLCAGVTVLNAIRQQHIMPGSSICAIQGLGGLGHLGLQYASKAGYRTVALSSSSAKENFARELGAHEYIDGSKVDQATALQQLGGADVIVCTAPHAEVIKGLVHGLAPTGKLVIVALAGEVVVDSTVLIAKGLSVGGWPSGHALDCEDAIRFAGVQGVRCLVERFPLLEARRAYERMLSGKARFRVVLEM